jgi:hypothetical protein
MITYILQSKALDGRYNGPLFPLHNEGEFAPIYAQDSFTRYPKGKFLKSPSGEPVVQWKGGPYPSGHVEVYEPIIGNVWRNETLPMPLKKAEAEYNKRNHKGSFTYRLIEATKLS